ncbi:MAG: TVP38/TMEM64 family protein [Opitutaceae bacterium]
MSETPESPSRIKRNLLLLLIPAVLSAATLYAIWSTHPEIEYWKDLLYAGLHFLEANPWALVLALATLPGFGFPISPLLILVGVVLGPIYGLPTACLIGIVAQSICTTWTYLLAAGPLRGILKRYLLRKRNLPELTEGNAVRFALIMRITPGLPYALQNVVLGIIGLKLKPYLLVSIPLTSLWTIGFVFTGGALFEGSVGLIITGILLLVILVLATRMLRNRTKDNYAG